MAETASSVRNAFQDFLLTMAGKFEPYPFLRSDEVSLRQLAETLAKPFTLAVFGRMKTGKSSLINALMGKPLAITGVEEATATLNWISYGSQTQANTVLVHWKDGRVEPLPLDRLRDWSGKEPEVLERVSQTAFLQLFSDAERLRDVQIVDTPGTGSVADEHEEVAQRFLSPAAGMSSEEEGKKADALLYVFPPVARERDEDALSEFRKSRLPGSDPYNSIGVLHKWDGLEVENIAQEAENKSKRLLTSLNDIVCDIIPVSAPLAMAARNAPNSFLESLLEITSAAIASDSLIKAMRMDGRWDGDEHRKAVRHSYPLPWVSFVRLVKLMIERSCDTVADTRAAALEASGIERLESELDRRFFRRAAIIKQRLILVKAIGPVQHGLTLLNRRVREIETDHSHFNELASTSSTPQHHQQWLQQKASQSRQEADDLAAYAIAADREWLIKRDRMDLMEKDLVFIERIEMHPDFVEPRDVGTLRNLLTSATTSNEVDPVPIEVLKALLGRYQHHIVGPDRVIRELFEHLIRRIQEQIQAKTQKTSL